MTTSTENVIRTKANLANTDHKSQTPAALRDLMLNLSSGELLLKAVDSFTGARR